MRNKKIISSKIHTTYTLLFITHNLFHVAIHTKGYYINC